MYQMCCLIKHIRGGVRGAAPVVAHVLSYPPVPPSTPQYPPVPPRPAHMCPSPPVIPRY